MNNKDNGLRARKDFGVTESKKRDYPPLPEKLPATTIDSHCHLDIEDKDIYLSVEDALEKAAAVGISGIVQVGVDVPSSKWAVKTAKEFSQVHATVALHPNDAPLIALEKSPNALDEAIAEIADLAKMMLLKQSVKQVLTFLEQHKREESIRNILLENIYKLQINTTNQ